MNLGYKIKMLGALFFLVIKELFYIVVAFCLFLPIGVLVGIYKSIFGGGYYESRK